MAEYTKGNWEGDGISSHRRPFFLSLQEPGWQLTLSQSAADNASTEAAALRTKVDSLETESLSLTAKITGVEADLSTCRSCVKDLRREVRGRLFSFKALIT